MDRSGLGALTRALPALALCSLALPSAASASEQNLQLASRAVGIWAGLRPDGSAHPEFSFGDGKPRATISIWEGLRRDGSRKVMLLFSSAMLQDRKGIQRRFVRELIWPRYGRKTRWGRKLMGIVDGHYAGAIRDQVIRQIRRRYPQVYPFGTFLDATVTRVVGFLERAPTGMTHALEISIPERFFVRPGAAEFEIEVIKSRRPRMDLYQVMEDGRRLLVFRTLAAPGNPGKGFGTPNGILYASRYIDKPRWYPCATKWAEVDNCRQRRGLNTAFGLHGMDLTRQNYLIGHRSVASGGTVSPYLIHSTNKFGSPGRYASHGCVRIFPHKADDLFRAIVHYIGSGDTRLRDFGRITTFVKTIPVMIGAEQAIPSLRAALYRTRHCTWTETCADNVGYLPFRSPVWVARKVASAKPETRTRKPRRKPSRPWRGRAEIDGVTDR